MGCMRIIAEHDGYIWMERPKRGNLMARRCRARRGEGRKREAGEGSRWTMFAGNDGFCGVK